MAKPLRGDDWIAAWLAGVASGRNAMSQRTVASIEKHGGLDRLVELARAQDVHLVQLTDDKDKALVAASRRPFRSLC